MLHLPFKVANMMGFHSREVGDRQALEKLKQLGDETVVF